MKPPTREELLAGLEDAERVLRPGEALALLEPRLRAARRDRRPAERGGRTGEALRERRARAARAHPHRVRAASGRARPATTSIRTRRPRDASRRTRPSKARSPRWVGSGRRSTTLPGGRTSSPRAGRRARPRDARRDGAGAHDGRSGGVDARLGARARALPARRPGLRRARRRDAGVPRRSLRPPPRAHRCRGALQHERRGARRSALALDLAEAVLEELPRAPERVAPRRRRARTTSRRCSGRWWSEGSELVLSWQRRAPAARARRRPAGPQRLLAAAGSRAIAGASSRAASSGSCSGSPRARRRAGEALRRDVPADREPARVRGRRLGVIAPVAGDVERDHDHGVRDEQHGAARR